MVCMSGVLSEIYQIKRRNAKHHTTNILNDRGWDIFILPQRVIPVYP